MLLPLLLSIVALDLISVTTEVVVTVGVVVTGVIVMDDDVVLGESKFCGGSGMRPLRLARISATFRRSVWLVEFGLCVGVSLADTALTVEVTAKVLADDEVVDAWSLDDDEETVREAVDVLRNVAATMF